MNSFAIEMEMDFAVPAKKVFDALTKNINKWWSDDYHIGEKVKKFVLEPKLGGRMYEVWGEGEGTLWGTVTEIKKNQRLEVTGSIGMSGATLCKLGFDLEPRGKSECHFIFSHHGIGAFEDGISDEYKSGWETIFADLAKFLKK